MLTNLPGDILSLIFEQLSCADLIALRSVCQSFRRYYRHHRVLKLTQENKIDENLPKEIWEDFVNFRCYGRLTFAPKKNRNVEEAVSLLHQRLPELHSTDVASALTQLLTKALYKHPPQVIIGAIEYYDDYLYLLSTDGTLYRNDQVLAYHVERFIPGDDSEVIICGGGVMYLFYCNNTTVELPYKPEMLISGRYIVDQTQIMYLHGSNSKLVNVTGWSFPMGIIDLAYIDNIVRIEDKFFDVVAVVTTYNQAFALIIRHNVIVQVVPIVEDVVTVFGLYKGFLFLHSDGSVSTAEITLQGPVSFTCERIGISYQRLHFVGRNNERCDFIGFRGDTSDRVRVIYNPFEVAIKPNKKLFTITLELYRGTYEVVN